VLPAVAVPLCGASPPSVAVRGPRGPDWAPAPRRGEGTGLAGLVSSGPAVLALPSGVWLAQHYGYGLVTLAAAAAALAPLAVLPGLPGRTRRAGRDHRQAVPAPVQDGAPLTPRGGLRQPAPRRIS